MLVYRRCASCLGPTESSLLCPLCQHSLVPIRPEACCPGCALPRLDLPSAHLCGRCLLAPPPWRCVQAAYAYGGALQAAIRRWKNAPKAALGPDLARLLVEALPVAGEGRGRVVVPMPSRWGPAARRGFSPAAILASGVARHWGLPLIRGLELHRRGRGTKGLGAERRLRRLRGRLRGRTGALRGRPVVLVDDVMTTGGTARAAARALGRAGCPAVEVVVLARVPPR